VQTAASAEPTREEEHAVEHLKRGRSALTIGADAAAPWRDRGRDRTVARSGATGATDDDNAFAGTPEELEALMRGGEPPAHPRSQSGRWPLAVGMLIIVTASLGLWGGLFLLLR
jgi:hypothetical protein